MEQGRGATGNPRGCLWDALANRLGWTPRLPGLMPRGGPWAGEKGRVNLAPHSHRGLSGLLAHLAPRRRLQAVPASAHSVPAAESRDAGRAPRSPAPPPRGHPFPEPRGPSRASRCSLPASPRPFSPALPHSSPRERPRPLALAVARPRCAFPPSFLGAVALWLSRSRHRGGPGFRCSTRHSPIAGCLCLSVCCLSVPPGCCLVHC